MERLDLQKLSLKALNNTEMASKDGGYIIKFCFCLKMGMQAFGSAFKNAGAVYDNISGVGMIKMPNSHVV